MSAFAPLRTNWPAGDNTAQRQRANKWKTNNTEGRDDDEEERAKEKEGREGENSLEARRRGGSTPAAAARSRRLAGVREYIRGCVRGRGTDEGRRE